MKSNIFFKTDIANVLAGLASAEQAKEDSREQEPTQCERYYHAAVKATLVAVGASFGLGSMIHHWRPDGPEWIEMDRGAGQ